MAAATTATPATADVLVADRLTNSVYRYSAAGELLNVVLSEVGVPPENRYLDQPTGLALSPDGMQMYVSSSQTNTVVQYDYDATLGVASNPSVFADELDGLSFPSSLLFDPAGDTLYVSNLGGTGVARFSADGSSAGAPLGAFGSGAYEEFSGLAWTPSGELLVGGFLNALTGADGAVGKSDAGLTTLSTFIGPEASLTGASGVAVIDDFVYATGMFASTLQRFHLSDGSPDATFGVSGLAFPQGIMAAPDGNGLLVGILGYAAGNGHIAHYDTDGNLVGDGIFAAPGGGGFSEATVFITTPNAPATPGDFNSDGSVNAADLAVWSTNFGDQSGAATAAMGDATGDGNVNGADLLLWQQHAASVARSIAAAAGVPEPDSAVLIVAALLVVFSHRRLRAEAIS